MEPNVFPRPAPATRPIAIGCCAPESLAALGPLLCLHSAADANPLAGWSRAVQLVATVRLDSDGPHEALEFFDPQGHCCWRLQLLPDSDFHSWEKLLSRLPVASAGPRSEPRARWPSKRAASPRWRACALRFHALPEGGGRTRLAAADVMLSELGRACLSRVIAGSEGHRLAD